MNLDPAITLIPALRWAVPAAMFRDNLAATTTAPSATRASPQSETPGNFPDTTDTVGDPLPCRVNDADLWFAESPAEVELAKALCLQCPLRGLCLSGAVERREPWGVWGGELFVQGVVIPRKRPRGRPRKNDEAAPQESRVSHTK